jgi:hypothetical protein
MGLPTAPGLLFLEQGGEGFGGPALTATLRRYSACTLDVGGPGLPHNSREELIPARQCTTNG